MRIFKCLSISVMLFFHTALCFAQDSVNLQILPDPTTHCTQLWGEVAITTNSTLGVMPASCSNRPTVGTINNQVSDSFNRISFSWKYSPHGAFKDGYFLMAGAGVETHAFSSVAGSTANVTYIDTGLFYGYSWFWRNGLNCSVGLGVAHLMPVTVGKSISTTETSTVSDYLDQQTSTSTHMGTILALGWAF